MNAVISGQTGVGILVDGEELVSLRAGSLEPASCTPMQVPYLIGSATDLAVMENVQVADVAAELELARDREDALQMALILLDPSLPEDVREEAAAAFDELLCDERVARHV
ncbi:hypothetical protein HQ590_15565, partial [bacterium]|nr:hypothetical protein [bacterium]